MNLQTEFDCKIVMQLIPLKYDANQLEPRELVSSPPPPLTCFSQLWARVNLDE